MRRENGKYTVLCEGGEYSTKHPWGFRKKNSLKIYNTYIQFSDRSVVTVQSGKTDIVRQIRRNLPTKPLAGEKDTQSVKTSKPC